MSRKKPKKPQKIWQRKKVTPESALKRAVREYAPLIGLRLWSILGGLGQEPGIADFLGVYKGLAIAVETKAGKNQLSAHQINFRNEWVRHGGIYIECRQLEDIANALGVKTLFN